MKRMLLVSLALLVAPLVARAGAPVEAPSAESRAAFRRGAFARLHQQAPGAPEATDGPLEAPTMVRAAGEIRKATFPECQGELDLRHPVVLAHGAQWAGALGIERLRGDYWKGVRERLEELDVEVLAPRVEPAGSIEERAEALRDAIVERFGDRPVNIVAHSMGGLDARYAISRLGMGDRVASLTTVSTPHHGSFYADFAAKFVYELQGLEWLAGKAELNARAIEELAVANIEERFNPQVPDHPEVRYYSYAGVIPIWRLPLYSWGMKLVVSLAEKAACKLGVGRASRAALEKALPGAAATALEVGVDSQGRYSWILPEEAGRSDGVVSSSSARWGTYLGEVPFHHLAQVGSTRRVDHVELWEGVVRRLAEQGH